MPGFEETARAMATIIDASAKQHVDKPSPYQRIGESLVNADELRKILQILIDDYTVAKLEQDGTLISPDLLEFQTWVNARYPG